MECSELFDKSEKSLGQDQDEGLECCRSKGDSQEFMFLLTRCYHDMDRGPLNYLIIPSNSTPGTFSTQLLRLIRQKYWSTILLV